MAQQHRLVYTIVSASNKDIEPDIRKMFDALVTSLKIGPIISGTETTVEMKKWDPGMNGWITSNVYPRPEVVPPEPIHKLDIEEKSGPKPPKK